MNILLDPGSRPVVGHRGNRAHAPENTIESFTQAVALGAEAIEFDVRLSADGIAVVHHDPTLARTTDGTGEIARTNLVDLKSVDAGSKFTRDGGRTFPYRGTGIRIPTFEEVVDAFPSTALLIEIKDPLAAGAVRQILEAKNAENRALVDAFDELTLRRFVGSEIACGASRNDVARLMAHVAVGLPVSRMTYRALCVPLSYKRLPLPIRGFVKPARAHDVRIHVWTINDPAVAVSLWNSGVNGIISDDPGLMLEARSALLA